jgi:hypothetical protein
MSGTRNPMGMKDLTYRVFCGVLAVLCAFRSLQRGVAFHPAVILSQNQE